MVWHDMVWYGRVCFQVEGGGGEGAVAKDAEGAPADDRTSGGTLAILRYTATDYEISAKFGCSCSTSMWFGGTLAEGVGGIVHLRDRCDAV